MESINDPLLQTPVHENKEKIPILLFGVTGMTGKHVLQNACSMRDHFEIFAYVRNVSKIPADLKSQIKIFEGDFHDYGRLKEAIISSKPVAIIVTSSLGRGTNEPVSFNQAIVPKMVEALKEDNRSQQCRLLYLSGAFSPEYPFEEYNCVFTIAFTAIFIRGAVYDNTAVQKYLYETSPDVCYTVVKMGLVSEGISKGKLIPIKAVTGDYGAVFRPIVFTDMAALLLNIAQLPLSDLNRGSYVVKYA